MTYVDRACHRCARALTRASWVIRPALPGRELVGGETGEVRTIAAAAQRADDVDEYEYVPLRIDPIMSRSAAATMLAVRAEFGGWELARVLRYPDGSRRVWLRRRRAAGWVTGLTP